MNRTPPMLLHMLLFYHGSSLLAMKNLFLYNYIFLQVWLILQILLLALRIIPILQNAKITPKASNLLKVRGVRTEEQMTPVVPNSGSSAVSAPSCPAGEHHLPGAAGCVGSITRVQLLCIEVDRRVWEGQVAMSHLE